MNNNVGEAPDLPAGWARGQLQDLSEIILGQSPPSSTYNTDGDGLPFYQGKLEFGNLYPSPVKWCSVPKKIAQKGDVLISVRAPVGPTNICPDESCIGRGLAAIRGSSGVGPLFILYLIRAYEVVLSGKGTGTTFSAISGGQLRTFDVPIPPLNEQHRIVAKIEELFTNLDAGVEAMKKVQAQIKRYRQAVLKYAFEGKLTAEWREAHKDELEPASILLERIREKRKKKLGGKYKEPPEVDTTDLPELPVGWTYSFLDDLVSAGHNSIKRGPFGSAVKKEYFVPSGYKVYEQKNVIYDDFTLGSYYIDENKYCELEAFEVQPGDVLISCSGTIGRIAVVPSNAEKGIINQALLKISLEPTVILNEYFLHLFKSDLIQKGIITRTRGSAMANISSVRDLKGIPIPLPHIREQVAILAEIERRLSIAESINNILDTSIKQSDRLRQSILKRAFEGKLVPQDPNDEPADKLLERIREERGNQTAEAKKTRGRKRS